MKRTLDDLYANLWHGPAGVYGTDIKVPEPRSPQILYDILEKLALRADAAVLDVGCGLGEHACKLASRFPVLVTGVDIVDRNVQEAARAAARNGLSARVRFEKADVEKLPFPDAAFDLVWCSGMVHHLPDLRRGLAECWRVLKPQGRMLLLNSFATQSLEPGEAERICAAHQMTVASLWTSEIERCLSACRFRVVAKEDFGNEFSRFYDERDLEGSKALRLLARMIWAKEELIAESGEAWYEERVVVLLWRIYHMIGKLSFFRYTLEKA